MINLPIPDAESRTELVPVADLLGSIPAWIVGRRYYRAAPEAGGELRCERQPDNPHDADAIAVYKASGGQVGHLPRSDAAYLAPLLDRGAIRLVAHLSGSDDPGNRTPIRLDVYADIHADALTGACSPAGAQSVEAIWHALLIAVWRNRACYAHQALAAFREDVRDVAHAGRLWPASQLFYRLLKGVVVDAEAADEARRREEVRRVLEEEEARRDAEIAAARAALAFAPCGSPLAFGHLRLWPLRSLRPASVLPLAEALREGVAALSRADAPRQVCVRMEGNALVMAVANEVFDTTAGRLRVLDDQVFASEPGWSDLLNAVPDRDEDSHRGEPVFLVDAAREEPAQPRLPDEANGFAVFRGAACIHLALFGHPGCAAGALPILRKMGWHLRPGQPGGSAAEDLAVLQTIIAEAMLTPEDRQVPIGDVHPMECPAGFEIEYLPESSSAIAPLEGRAMLNGAGELVFLRLAAQDAGDEKCTRIDELEESCDAISPQAGITDPPTPMTIARRISLSSSATGRRGPGHSIS